MQYFYLKKIRKWMIIADKKCFLSFQDHKSGIGIIVYWYRCQVYSKQKHKRQQIQHWKFPIW